MPKKGQTNNPHGRPKLPERNIYDKQRQLGRVSDDDWQELKAAAAKDGKSFTQWALDLLLKAARK